MKKILQSGFLLLFLMGAIRHVEAQTTLINPTGAGGFELGSTFAANGWTVVNGTPANRWVCSTGATAGFSGVNAAYISSNDAGAPPPHTYITTQSSTVHLYRDVTFPMGETLITFNFDIRMTGETGWDRLLVYISNSTPSGTPSAGIPLSNTTTLTEYTLLSTQAQALSWTKRTVTITAAQAGNAAASSTRRILFVWQNNAGGGPNPPVAIDNINLVSAVPPANDNCANATAFPTIPGDGSCVTLSNQTTFGATNSNVIPSGDCINNSGTPDDDVWFSFVAPGTAVILQSTYVSGVSDVYWQVFSGSCAATMTSLLCTDNNGGGTITGLVTGQAYYIRLYTRVTAVSTVQNVCLRLAPPPPANDLPCNATTLTIDNPTPACTNTTNANYTGSQEPEEFLCDFISNNTVWYKFTAMQNGQHNLIVSIPVNSSSPMEANIHLYRATGTCPGTLTFTGAGGVSCWRGPSAAGGSTTINTTALVAGTTYYIYVDGYADDFGDVCLQVTSPPACPAPTGLSMSGITATSANASWTPVAGETAWDLYYGPTPLTAPISTTSPTENNVVTNTDYTLAQTLTPLTSYQIYVRTDCSNATSAWVGPVSFTTPLANDHCAGAISLTTAPGVWAIPAPTVYNNGSATQSLAPAFCQSYYSLTALDVWYSFQADANGGDINLSYIGDNDVVIEAFSGSCGALTSIGCSDDSGNFETFTLTALPPNGGPDPNIYYLRIYAYDGGTFGDPESFTGTITASGTALPLELASFTGKTESRSNMLRWETLTEKNVQWHIVERSVDGIKWMEVGKTAGQMDAQVPVKYELEDRAPLAKAYYRLRSVDYDGAENLSNTIVLTRKGEHFGITAAFPSPTMDQVTVQFASLKEEDVTIQVMDISGRLVLVQEYAADNGINEAVLQLANLQTGVYLVRISNATATAEPMRIVKE